MVLGLYTFGKIGVELYPAVNTPYVSVSVSYPGAGAEEIETQIIKPLEDSLSSLGQLKNIMSTATTGRGTVILEFDLSVDADEVAIDVQKTWIISGAACPTGRMILWSSSGISMIPR
ncbi:hypothetical protein P378_03250 [Desulforamulus profundi]|uniref:Acriflavin resistance protein n=1 Tax=Desulforamulus profundi TaxID=1383067 RepID=A0A2C6MGR9_9FIRM|nr:hypothetical protein P378_03250 [Desulforamulus profundi]